MRTHEFTLILTESPSEANAESLYGICQDGTLAARGKAVLYSSHVLDLVEKVCDRVVVIHRGQVVADDAIDNLRRLMASPSLEDVFFRATESAQGEPERAKPQAAAP